MMRETKIEWTDRTWNPATGCTKVSPGCDHCYADGIATRFAGSDAFPEGFEVTLRPEKLAEPLRWRKPGKTFVNSMFDLWHDKIPDEFIAAVWCSMYWTSRPGGPEVYTPRPRQTYQILTKRHARLRSWVRGWGNRDQRRAWIKAAAERGWCDDDDLSNAPWMDAVLRNVWLGVSVEDQQRADLRIPALLDTPAAVRFLSCEPLLGPVDLTQVADKGASVLVFDALGKRYGIPGAWQSESAARVDWVIVGGESGSGARPMHPDWARQLRDQSATAGVPFFFKQAGKVLAREWGCSGSKGDDPAEWPEPFPREFPKGAAA